MGGSCRRGGDFGPAAGDDVGTDPQGRHALRRQDHRSVLDDCLHRAQLRLHGLRHAAGGRRQAAGQAADAGRLEGERRQAHLYLHPARRAFVPRRPARDGRGLRGVAQSLGTEGRDGAEADVLHQGAEGRRRQDLHPDAQGALRPGAGIARQALLAGAVHHAQAGRRRRRATCRSARPSARARSSSARTCGGRASASIYDKFKDYKPRAEPASGLSGGKVVHVDRVEWHNITDPQTVDQRADQRRDRHDRPAGDRAAGAAGRRQEHQGRRSQPAGQPRSTSASTRCTSPSTTRRSARPCSMR